LNLLKTWKPTEAAEIVELSYMYTTHETKRSLESQKVGIGPRKTVATSKHQRLRNYANKYQVGINVIKGGSPALLLDKCPTVK